MRALVAISLLLASTGALGLTGAVKKCGSGGICYITPDDGGEDIPFWGGHAMAPGAPFPSPGLKVEYQVTQAPGGPEATSIRIIGGPDPAPPRLPQFVGTVRYLDPAKGFGMIESDDGGVDVFLRSPVKGITNGMRVRYDVVRTIKGLEARNVIPLK